MGASGYTGSEVLRMLLKHPLVKIKELIGDQNAGKKISEIFSNINDSKLPLITSLNQVNLLNIDVIFCCTPTGVLASVIDQLPKDLIIIDLSADFRFKELNLYEDYYEKHKNPKFMKKFTYGLSEVFRNDITKSKFISCPGCYPTSILLPLIPLIKSNIINIDNIIIDSKSGITGAGRNIKQELLFSENFGSIRAYGNGRHRHKPEIEHILKVTTKQNIHITFTPHIIPINRGILSTIYVKKQSGNILKCLKNYYENEKFIYINEVGSIPKISDVVGSNHCRIGLIENKNSEWFTIISVIDNLIKGASGQAIQNLNILMNWSEDLGLDNHSLYP